MSQTQRKKHVPVSRRVIRTIAYTVLIATTISWLVPLVWAAFTSLRSYQDTAQNGYVSLPTSFSFDNFIEAWTQGKMGLHLLNSLIITIPGVVIVLLLASFAGYVIVRVPSKLNMALLLMFTAANLLPPQVLIAPLFRVYLATPLPEWLSDSGLLYDSLFGVLLMNVVFQLGFCVFVLSNYMRTIPAEITEAAIVDGASVFRQYWQVVLPLVRPALGALGTLEFTWIYNDFFWGLVLMQSPDKRPITSALTSLQGSYFTDNNMLAAGALLTAIPTLIVYVLLRRQMVSGLTLGSTKG
jgi:multiple sugar transport system permease protein